MSKNMNLTLAISKIEDLLINNRITINSAGNSIDNIKLCIPDYQRPYKWSAQNALQLFDDIISSGSNWSPKTKLDHYLDNSGKVKQVSVASLKFMIMMQFCQDNQQWNIKEIRNHQAKMLEILKD